MEPQQVISILQDGGIGVMPTDTLYGLVGSALRPSAVERIYKVRQRDDHKPLIVLIGSLKQLELFDIELSRAARHFLDTVWPGPVSVILPAMSPKFRYLHRGSGGISFRLPADQSLRGLLLQAGPIVAPSANPQGEESATSIEQAEDYFGDHVDFYMGRGSLNGQPSTLVRWTESGPQVLRGSLNR